MSKIRNPKPTSLQEELEAAQLERPSRAISVSRFLKVQRVHIINSLLKPLETEKEGIKAEVFAEMDKKGVDVLTRKGVEVVSRDTFTGSEFDVTAFKKDHPALYRQYTKKKSPSKRINWKTPLTF